MNERFYSLSQDKQQRIINAAYKVFALNSYKKAPMSEIANEAEISKALLFHYFRNKKALYLYLWDNAVDLTQKATMQYKTTQTTNFFEMLRRSLLAKCGLMRDYPYIYRFSMQAYYETEPEIKKGIQEKVSDTIKVSTQVIFETIDRSLFRPDIDPNMMYKEIVFAVDGYMLNVYRTGPINADRIENEIDELIKFWERVYTQQ